MASALNIGKIVNMHGLKGEVKVYPYTNDMKRFEEVGVVYTDIDCTKPLKIQGVKYQKSMVIVKFEGYDHINAVEHFKQVDLYIDRDTQGIDLEDEEFYIADLIGVMVVDQDGINHGVIKDVLQLKAQDVLEIEENGTKWFLPFVDPFIIEVDLEKNEVVVSLIEGLKDAH